MKLLFASTPAAGHVNPMLSLARIFIARGDEVIVTTGSHMEAAVVAVGARFAALDAAADHDYRHLEAMFPERAALPPGPAQLRFDFEKIFIDTIPAEAATLDRLIAAEKPDAVIAEASFFGRLPLFYRPRAERVPVIALGITFFSQPREDGAPIGLGFLPTTDPAQREQYAAVAAGVDAMFTAPVHAHLKEVLATCGTTAPVADAMAMMGAGADLFLLPTVPAFEYPVGEPAVPTRFIGALPVAPANVALPDWWDRIGQDDRPVVMVTQGTAANYDFDQLINPALAAMATRGDVDIVVTTGGRPVESIDTGGRENVFVTPFVDYELLIPRLSLLVTNGGYGTVSQALRHGVPIVAVGQTEDKAEVGARVEWSGVGLRLSSIAPTVEELAGAIGRVLAEPSFGERARGIAGDFAGIDTAALVTGLVDELVG